MIEKLFIIGSSGHAKEVIDATERNIKYEIVGILDDFKTIGSKLYQYTIVGKVEDIKGLTKKNNTYNVFIAVGDNYSRSIIYNKLVKKELNLVFVNIIHPNSSVSLKAMVSDGCYIGAGAIINAGAIIEKQCYVNYNASVGHDCIIREFSSIGPNATLAGGSKFGKLSMVGMGACVLEKQRIGNNTIIGAGSVVTKDFLDDLVVYGSPARVIRKRVLGEKYLK